MDLSLSTNGEISPSREQANPSEVPSPDERVVNGNERVENDSERVYEASGRSRLCLATLCIGLKKSDGNDLISLDEAPWNAEAKSTIKPKAKDLKLEVIRRSILQNVSPKPRPNAWSVRELNDWLMQHSVQPAPDVAFLMQEAERVTTMMVAAQREQHAENALLAQGADWRGNIPYLRLIHCLEVDVIKSAYLRRHDPWTRQQLDARQSESRPPTVFEQIADCFNDEEFNPCTSISDVHFDYSSSIQLDFESVRCFQPATAKKVEDKLAQLRASLTRIISKWEKSGQGDCGHHGSDVEDEDDGGHRDTVTEGSPRFGSLQDRPQFALDTRSSFLQGKPSYLLYFWEFAEKNGLLSSTLQKIAEEISASDGSASVPSIVSPQPRLTRKRDSNEADLAASIMEASRVQLLVSSKEVHATKELHMETRLAQLRDKKRTIRKEACEMMVSEHRSEMMIKFFQDEIKDIDDEIKEMQERMGQLPDPNNI